MYQYFKSLKEIANLDNTQYCIKDLTILIMTKAGYRLVQHSFKNGRIILINSFDKQFDDILFAKWILFYQKLFIAKLSKQHEFKEYQIDIINNTFFTVMKSLKIEKITDNNVVNRYVNLTLLSKMNDVLWEVGSAKRLDEYNRTKCKPRLRVKKYLLHNSFSYDSLIETSDMGDNYYEITDEILFELKTLLSDNPYGELVLQSLLYSNKKVNLLKIDEYIDIDRSMQSNEVKNFILDSINIIKKFLCDLNNIEFIAEKKVKFSNTA